MPILTAPDSPVFSSLCAKGEQWNPLRTQISRLSSSDATKADDKPLILNDNVLP